MENMDLKEENDEIEFIRAHSTDAKTLAPKIFDTFESVHKSKGGTTSDW
jgi:hypothetical protein